MPTEDPEDIVGRLRSAAAGGERLFFGQGEEIKAEWIRDILLSLPRGGATAPGHAVGLSIEGIATQDGTLPTINGRIELSDVSIPGDGGIAPLSITNCLLKGGFAGARTRFGSLRFKDCRFEDKGKHPEHEPADPADKREEILPTIDLGGARFDSGLYMAGITPHGSDDYLWIRAAGIRVAGALDLSRSRLRAPPDQNNLRLYCDQMIDGIDLTKAVIEGDFYGLNGLRCEGSFHARGVHVKGNVWLSGATIEAPGSRALMLQRAVIDGSLVLDAPPERADGSGAITPFVCAGNLSLRAARIGGDIDMQAVSIAGTANFFDLEVRNDLTLDAAVRDGIDLRGCRIGGTVSLSGLRVGLAFQGLSLRGGAIGRSLERKTMLPTCELLEARRSALTCISNATLVETLWKEKDNSKLYQAAFIAVADEYHLLDGFASGLQAVLANADCALDHEKQVEFLRLYGTYARGEAGFPVIDSHEQALKFINDPASPAGLAVAALRDEFFQVKWTPEDSPRIVTACVAHGDRLSRCAFTLTLEGRRIDITKKLIEDGPHIDREATAHGPFLTFQFASQAQRVNAINHKDWPLPPAAPDAATFNEAQRKRLEAVLSWRVAAALHLRGEIDLSNLECEMLDDLGGNGWGPLAHFELNHFVYRHAAWQPDKEENGLGILRRLIQSARVQLFGVPPPTAGVPYKEDFWKDWEVRRNWLFQQYYRPPPVRADGTSANLSPSDADDQGSELPSKRIFKFSKIKWHHFRPQPFEQLIRVARTEGRDEVATRFEILKRAIEWRNFNRHARWMLGYLGITLAAIWLLRKAPTTGASTGVVVTLVFTLVAMIFGFEIRKSIAAFIGKFRRAEAARHGNRTAAKYATWLAYILPAGVLFGAVWWPKPFHFLVAFGIFLVIRLVTTLANGLYWLCFGYARRPIRAIVTLIAAFLVGWVGVHVADRYGMLVVNAEPVGTVAAASAEPGPGSTEKRLVMGNVRVAAVETSFAHDFSCSPVLSEPLYALDVLIPIVDLGEERRCEIRRLESSRLGDSREQAKPRPKRPAEMNGSELVTGFYTYTFENYRFWWWMKALYAIAGWFIVSLSILTFAQTNRAHAEPPMEHK